MATKGVVDSQPQGSKGTSYTFSTQAAWGSDLFDCMGDMDTCLWATFLPCIFACRVAEKAGEFRCLPFLPGALIALRTAVRERYHIEGSILSDWVVMSCFPLCGLCQLHRELNKN